MNNRRYSALTLLATALAMLALQHPAISPRLLDNPPPARAQEPLRNPAFIPLAFRRGLVEDLPVAPTALPSAPTPVASETPVPTAEPPTATLEPTRAATATPTPSATPTPKAGYSEPLTDFPDLSDLRAGYRADRWYATLLEVLRRRYPTGRHIVTTLRDGEAQARFWVGSRNDTFDHLLDTLPLVVHEMNHQLGWQEGLQATRGQSYAYTVRDDLRLLVPTVDTFPRKEIAPYVVGPLANFYKATYLEGQGGEQDFQNLVDELNAYTHSLFTAHGTHDQFSRSLRQSHRDGLVTFMMYTEFYLRHARLRHASDYAALRARPEMRDAVALLWARAMFILDTTADIPNLALDHAAIEAEMRKADMLAEVEGFVAP